MALSLLPCYIFFLELGLVGTKIYRFVENTSVKSFKNFEQSAVTDRCQRYKNPDSSVVEESIKLLQTVCMAISFWIAVAIQLQCIRLLGKTHPAIIKKMFKTLGYINDQLCEVEHAKSEIELKKTSYCWLPYSAVS